jgi:hypothetical protein
MNNPHVMKNTTNVSQKYISYNYSMECVMKSYEQLVNEFPLERLYKLRTKLEGYNLPLTIEGIDNIIKEKLEKLV